MLYECDRESFYLFSHIRLNQLKLNSLVGERNYSYYFKNTPNLLLMGESLEVINNIYMNLDNDFGLATIDHTKYGLISVYQYLGNRLIDYYCKFMYTTYTKYFKSLARKGMEYSKFKVKISKLKSVEFDYYLSFTEFKNLLINEIGFLDTGEKIL